MTADLDKRFHEAMVDIYRRAKAEADYTASRFLAMLSEDNGVTVARTLINSPKPSEGYTALWERKRLDLAVEYLVLEPKWNSLFTDAERASCEKRLRDYGFVGTFPNSVDGGDT